MESYDLIVIGAGTGGLTTARLAARAGKRVALVERDRPGGDCLWSGCVPTKALIHAARLMHQARSGSRFGVHAGEPALDFAAVRRHVAASQELAGRVDSPEAIRSWGVDLVRGSARFVGTHQIAVGERPISGRQFVIATGSRPALPAIPGLREAGAETSLDLLEWETLPRTLAIIGGGPIGVEFAQMMQRFGVQVTVLERGPRLLEIEEPAASRVIERILREEGVDVRTGVVVERVERGEAAKRIVVRGHDVLEVERLVVATGRDANVDGLGLEAAGVRVGRRGILVDRQLRTSQPHIFAVGDVNGSPKFTHVAEDQARTVSRTITRASPFGRPARWSGRVVPRVTFTDPEVAAVGLTEAEARGTRSGVRTWNLPVSEVDRAITMGETDGFLQLVTAKGWQNRVPGLASRIGEEIVGACFVAPGAGDLLPPVVTAMRMRLPVGFVAWNMQAYPTLALGVRQVAGMPFDQAR